MGGDLALGLRRPKKSYHSRFQNFFEPNFRMTFLDLDFYFSSQNAITVMLSIVTFSEILGEINKDPLPPQI